MKNGILACLIILIIISLYGFCQCSYKGSEVELITAETDEALTEFQINYIFLCSDLVEQYNALNQEYNKYVRELWTIDDDLKDLDPKIYSYNMELFNLSQKALNILEKQQEILEKQKDNLQAQSRVISDLQGNVVRIKDPSKKLLAQEIADNLRKINNLVFELIELLKKNTEYYYSYYKDAEAFSKGIMTFEIMLEGKEVRDEKILKNNERIDEIGKVTPPLVSHVKDLEAKLDSLEP